MRISVIAIVVLIVGIASPGFAQDKARKLNVLFIAVDDLNTALGCYGHPIVKTPNIDRLAKRGMRFQRAYTQYPLCNPSRTSLMSGKRPDTTKVFDNSTPPRTTIGDVPFLNEYFALHGYFTARVGKILHGTFEDSARWDVSENPKKKKNADEELQTVFLGGDKKKKKGQGGIKITWKATDNRDDQEADGITARRIVELMRKHKDRPFFLAAGFHKPHLPFVAPKKYFDLYPPEKIVLPKEPADFRKNVPAAAFTQTAGDDDMTDLDKKQAIAAYYACISFMDAQVGVLLDALDELQLWDNTVVVFFSDHGFHLSDHGNLWRKMTLFENSAGVPMIVAPPKMKGASCARLVELVDLYPTLAELCKLPAPKGMEGDSFAPLLTNPVRPWKTGAFTVVQRGQKGLGRSVCTERYRYTEWFGDAQQAELYDHVVDPHELSNLAQDARHRNTVMQLQALLRAGPRAAGAK